MLSITLSTILAKYQRKNVPTYSIILLANFESTYILFINHSNIIKPQKAYLSNNDKKDYMHLLHIVLSLLYLSPYFLRGILLFKKDVTG